MKLFNLSTFLLSIHLCLSQIWKEPLDTLPSIDKYERVDPQSKAKSCLIQKFVTTNPNEVEEWEYKEYDRHGRITKFAAFENDTTYYFYNDFDVCQEIVYPNQKRQFTERIHRFENQRLSSIITIQGKDTVMTVYNHDNNLLQSIRYHNGSEVKFFYDSSNRVLRKEFVGSTGDIMRHTNFYYNSNKTSYSECLSAAAANDHKQVLCDTSIAVFDSQNRMIELYYNSREEQNSKLYFDYNEHGKIVSFRTNLTNQEHKLYEVKYFYNAHQLLIRTEYSLDGKIYMYHNFDWRYFD